MSARVIVWVFLALIYRVAAIEFTQWYEMPAMTGANLAVSSGVSAACNAPYANGPDDLAPQITRAAYFLTNPDGANSALAIMTSEMRHFSGAGAELTASATSIFRDWVLQPAVASAIGKHEMALMFHI